MLNEVSCWYVNWANIGTWVGGIGAAAAAFAAVWTVKHQECKRESFAQYLLKQDLNRLERIHTLLISLDGPISMFNSSDEVGRKEALENFDEALARCEELIRECEYFGHSEQQFYYRPKSKEFSQLARQAELMTVTPQAIRLVRLKPKVDISGYVKNAAEKLESAINVWKVSGQGKQ